MKKVFVLAIFFATVLTIVGNLGISRRNDQDISTQNRDMKEISDVIKKGETLFDIFKRYNLDLRELFELREASADIYRLRKLYPGQPYKIWVDNNDRVNSFIYWIDDDNILNITRSDSGFYAKKVAVAYEKRILHIGGTIQDNLISSIGGGGGEGGRGEVRLGINISYIFTLGI